MCVKTAKRQRGRGGGNKKAGGAAGGEKGQWISVVYSIGCEGSEEGALRRMAVVRERGRAGWGRAAADGWELGVSDYHGARLTTNFTLVPLASGGAEPRACV